jgi:hypothetical protein
VVSVESSSGSVVPGPPALDDAVTGVVDEVEVTVSSLAQPTETSSPAAARAIANRRVMLPMVFSQSSATRRPTRYRPGAPSPVRLDRRAGSPDEDDGHRPNANHPRPVRRGWHDELVGSERNADQGLSAPTIHMAKNCEPPP